MTEVNKNQQIRFLMGLIRGKGNILIPLIIGG